MPSDNALKPLVRKNEDGTVTVRVPMFWDKDGEHNPGEGDTGDTERTYCTLPNASGVYQWVLPYGLILERVCTSFAEIKTSTGHNEYKYAIVNSTSTHQESTTKIDKNNPNLNKIFYSLGLFRKGFFPTQLLLPIMDGDFTYRNCGNNELIPTSEVTVGTNFDARLRDADPMCYIYARIPEPTDSCYAYG